MQSHEQPGPRRAAEGRDSGPDTDDESAHADAHSGDQNETPVNSARTSTPPPWRQLLAGTLVHLLCYGFSLYTMIMTILLTWNDEQVGPPRALPWIGLGYWLAGGIWVWWLWGRKSRTIIPIFASTMAAMLLVRSDIGRGWPLVASIPDLQMFVWGLAVSTLPIMISWLAVRGPRWRTRLIHVAGALAAIAGGVVYLVWPRYDSVARALFDW